MPCASAGAADIEALQAAITAQPQRGLTLDLERCALRFGDRVVALAMPEAARSRLLDGTWDATGVLLASLDLVRQIARGLPYTTGCR